MHEKHRERVRKRLMQEGLEGFEPHEVLELLLFYAIPREDTNETAHRLIQTFGSLEAVLEAPAAELVKVKGVGEISASLLTLVPQLARRYYNAQTQQGALAADSQSVREFARAKYLGQKTEMVYLLCFNGKGKLLHCPLLADGGMTAARLDTRHLLETVLRHNASAVALMHNHPNGIAAPSHEDIEATKRIAAILRSVQIKLLDHLIVSGQEVFSMAETEKFRALFI